MEEKKCFKCGIIKPLSDYYKHKQMGDGHLNKCKSCVKEGVRKRAAILSKNDEWVKSEKKRHRDKYHRLGYKDKHKPTAESKKKAILKYRSKYPEKKRVKVVSNFLRRKLKIEKGIELHHWSYNQKDLKNVIILSIANHNTAHRFLVYDQSEKMYRSKDGELLDTNLKHYRYIEQFLKTA